MLGTRAVGLWWNKFCETLNHRVGNWAVSLLTAQFLFFLPHPVSFLCVPNEVLVSERLTFERAFWDDFP
jgi:hypothetical protein